MTYAQAYQKALARAHVKPDLPAIVEAFGPTPEPKGPAFVEYSFTGNPRFDIDFSKLCQPDGVGITA